jgi:putative ABC transport system ATP-binding protein
MMSLIVLEKVSKVYPGVPPVEAVKNVSFSLEKGSFAVLVGPSGSGKTTLLNMISSLDRPTEGKVWIGGREITSLSERQLTHLRRNHIGFVFQSFNLFPMLTARENVEYTQMLRGVSAHESKDQALKALESVGLKDQADRFPRQLSGGQQQRVAVARALASQADIVFADEPTANLDSKTAFLLIDLFERLNCDENLSFLFSTHDSRLVDRALQKFFMEDGQLLAGV